MAPQNSFQNSLLWPNGQEVGNKKLNKILHFDSMYTNQGCGAVTFLVGSGSGSDSGEAFRLRLRLRLWVKLFGGSGSGSGSGQNGPAPAAPAPAPAPMIKSSYKS